MTIVLRSLYAAHWQSIYREDRSLGASMVLLVVHTPIDLVASCVWLTGLLDSSMIAVEYILTESKPD